MTRRLILPPSLLLMFSSTLSAGVAVFDPPSVFVGPLVQVVMEITVEAQTLGNFDALQMVIFSDVPFDFSYSSEFLSADFVIPPQELDVIWDSQYELLVGGELSSPRDSILLGSIAVPSVGLDVGAYPFTINSMQDGGLSLLMRDNQFEGIHGQGFMYIGQPEPGSIMLLLAGALVVGRHRKS